MENRFERQRSLVYQDRVENLFIHAVGYNQVLSPFLLNCAYLNAGRLGGISIDTDYVVQPVDVQQDIFLDETTIGASIAETYCSTFFVYNDEVSIVHGTPKFSPDITLVFLGDEPLPKENINSKVLYCRTTTDGFYIGKIPVTYEGRKNNGLSVPLAYLAAGILMQEVLKVCNCLKTVQVLETKLQANVLVKSPLVKHSFGDEETVQTFFDARQAGNDVHLEPLQQTKRNEAYYTIDLEDKFPELLESIDITTGYRHPEMDKYLFSMFDWCSLQDGNIECSIDPSFSIPKKLNVTIPGLGALGSFVSQMLTRAPIKDLELNLVDPDTIEHSNLNRQLFATSEEGELKVYAAERAIREIRSDVVVRSFPLQIDESFLEILQEDYCREYQHPESWSKEEETNKQMVLSEMLASSIKLNVLCYCVDSMQTRWVLEQVSKHPAIHYAVNAGTNGFLATVDLIRKDQDANLEERYGDWIKEDTERHSCTGEIPIPGCVTSTMIAASLQVLFLLTAHHKCKANFYRFTEDNTEIESMLFQKPQES